MTYAANTTVSVDKSKYEIESTLRRYGASMFFSGWDDDSAFVAFKMADRHVKLTLPLPLKDDPEIVFYYDRYKNKKKRTDSAINEEYEQRTRAKFRALLLVVKAKLESVEAKIETFEQAFLAWIVLPDKSLVGDRMKSIIDTAYRTGTMSNLLPAPGESEVES